MKRQAFTLAEVLIVIGIIGIIAETTIPVLLANYQKEVTVSQLKNIYSTLNQALKASIADNGEVSDWDYVGTGDFIGEKYIIPYLRLTSKLAHSSYYPMTSNGINHYDFAPWDGHGYILADGTFIYFSNGFPGNSYDWSSNYAFRITVDLNGFKKGPNRAGHDIFTFEIPTLKSNTKNRHLNTIMPIYYYKTSDDILNGNGWYGLGICKGKGVATDGHYSGDGCLKVIMDDGWQITSRYPWW